MKKHFEHFLPAQTALSSGLFKTRQALNRAYMLQLRPNNILQNHYLEAGLGDFGQIKNTVFGGVGFQITDGEDRHWGWESPSCQVRGQFLGHWLSAAARLAAAGDAEMRMRAEHVVKELLRCQMKNGGEWVFAIPEKYLHWTAQGQTTWAPQYVIHKTLMGLLHMHKFCGSATALEIAARAAAWFQRWSSKFSREQMDKLLDYETGGSMEAWADLYAVTGERAHRELMERYARQRLFKALLTGKDVLTNQHANTTIPEIHGAARAYEVTGREEWRAVVEAYWDLAVTRRGTFATGGQTAGELWTPPFEYAARRGDKNQEHCTVYNMIRLADYLLRWTGDARYADYIERNLWNGILAQQHARTGLVSYFLPLAGGSRKTWGSATNDFWCCHGTLVQAHTLHDTWIYYRSPDGVAVAQYMPSTVDFEYKGATVRLEQTIGEKFFQDVFKKPVAKEQRHRPQQVKAAITVTCSRPTVFELALRVPDWVRGAPQCKVNGKTRKITRGQSGFFVIRQQWRQDRIELVWPRKLEVHAIPDEPDTVAFLDGPVVLAGLCDHEMTLYGSKSRPADILKVENECQWDTWLNGYRTSGQPINISFRPLYEITDETYTVYFPIRRQQSKK